mmetsp:Transcript_19360/g.36553  ORF Transcript_19360/g.36553 Transcript_19360/m.36553 type:complete len:201 (-) Transcript_19360:37-639(-)
MVSLGKFLLSLSFLSCAMAWNVPSQDVATQAPSLGRRAFLLTPTPVVVVGVGAASQLLVTVPPAAAAAAAALDTDAATTQWKSAVATIDQLLAHWDTTYAKGTGDAIRTKLGTQGITSPLFQIDKALRVLRDKAADIVEFTEQTDEFLLTLSRADSMAYSANFAGGSGKPTPPAVYIEKAHQEIVKLQNVAQSLSLQLEE